MVRVRAIALFFSANKSSALSLRRDPTRRVEPEISRDPNYTVFPGGFAGPWVPFRLWEKYSSGSTRTVCAYILNEGFSEMGPEMPKSP